MTQPREGDGSLSPVDRRVIDNCLDHAQDLLEGASALIEKKLPHLAYHLAVLALEEVGKAWLMVLDYSAQRADKEGGRLNKASEDHVRKLFWALWGAAFGKEKITESQVRTYQGLASCLHETRLAALYFQPEIERLPKDTVAEEQVRELLDFVSARIALTRPSEPVDLPPEEREDLDWFLESSEDPQKRNFMLTGAAQDKLLNLGGDVKAWIRWMRETVEKSEAEAIELSRREFSRTPPSGDERGEPKWKVRIRVYSDGQSVRPKVLSKWNERDVLIKLFPVDKSKKTGMFVEFTLAEHVKALALWNVGLLHGQRFLIALNIGAMGFFWWHLPQHTSRYYEKLTDLDGNRDLTIDAVPRMKIDWGHAALTDRDLRHAGLCFAMLPPPGDKEKNAPFGHYYTGLAFLAKSDLHFSFEANCLHEFYLALKKGMRVYGDFNDQTSLLAAFDKTVPGFVNRFRAEFASCMDLGAALEANPEKAPKVTLTDVANMKLFADAYFLKTFDRLMSHVAARRKKDSDDKNPKSKRSRKKKK